MNKDEYNFTKISKEYLTISIEPDIHLSDNEQIHLNKCFYHLSDISYIPLFLNCILIIGYYWIFYLNWVRETKHF